MRAALVLLAAMLRSASAVLCSSITDPATFCAESPSEGQFGLIDNAAEETCAGDPCTPEECCDQCTVADYISNTVGCPNDCASCDNDNGDTVGCTRCFCAATGRPPQKSKVPLNICHMYTDYTCCLPVVDTEIDEHYNILLDAGDRCAQELVKPKLYLRDMFCMACSPEQPKYVVNNTLQICQSLVDEIEPSLFDECGMVAVAERGNLCEGDDSVMPSLHWETVLAFIEDGDGGAKPPFLEDFDIAVVADDTNCYKNEGVKGVAPLLVVFLQLGSLFVALFVY